MAGAFRTAVVRRLFPSRQAALARTGALVGVLGVSSLAALVMAGASGTSATADVAVPTATATLVRPTESETQRDLWQYADVEFRSQATATPTITPAPATATAVPPPPTVTPRPAVAQRQRSAPSAPPPPAAPTATRVPPTPAPAAPVVSGLDTSPMDAFEQGLFDATNARRVASGMAPLRVNGWLIGVGRIRSDDMAANNYFAHTSPVTGHTAFSLMDLHGVPYAWAGENLAKNNYPIDQTVAVADEALWNSPPHRENILNPNYTDMGIALTIDATGMKYFTILFTGP